MRILGRCQPGVLTGHDFLDCDNVIKTEFVNANFSVTLLPEDLEDWEDAESGGLWVSVHDGPSSGVTVTVPLFVPSPKWVAEQRDLLAQAREAYPREVVETSPGAYEWRRARNV